MFNTKKNIAIKALSKQKEKLTDPKYYNDWDWVAQTADIVKKYIGEDSVLHNTLIKFDFGVLHNGGLTNEQISGALSSKKRTASRYIDNCIGYIELNGVKKEPKINFLQKLSDKVIWSILIGIMTFGFFLGNFLKSVEIDKEKIQLEEQVKSLNSQIKDYKSIISNHQKNQPLIQDHTEQKATN